MAGGGGHGGHGHGKTWVGVLVAGIALCGVGYGLKFGEVGPSWVATLCLAVGGLAVVFGSCEAMIMCVEGVGERLDWNQFVAGTIAGLASNIPEIVMLGFVVAAEPRVAFVVVVLTLHVNALMFGVYSAVLPRDQSGRARLPEPLVKISTDLYAAGGGVFLATGCLMLLMTVFESGEHDGEAFGVTDLYVIGICLLMVQVVATAQLIKRFSKPTAKSEEEVPLDDVEPAKDPPSWGVITGYGLLGAATSVLGGHAVGEFADSLVDGLNEAGYPEMVSAIILSLFAGAGAYALITTAHVKKLYDIALANVSGSITQVPFVVLPAVMILMAILAQTGVIPSDGGVLAIDLETTSVVLLAFPPMLLLWKSVQDDGKVNWVETAGMVAVFGLTLYFLAMHG